VPGPSLDFQEEFEDTKGVIIIRISKKNTTQWPKEKGQGELEDAKGVIKIRISKRNRQRSK
jgi:hypothetical protein